MELRGCTALITGASAGLGREFARQLAGRAGCIVLVARRRERLEELRDELTKIDPNLDVHVRATDLAKKDQVDELCAWLKEQQIVINFLINNAGLGDYGAFSASDPGRVSDMLQVNIVALTSLTHRLLPQMITQKRGGILNVSSSASFLPIPGLAVYAASKAYVTSFSEALRSELRGSGVTASALCPGPVQTEFNSVATRADTPPKQQPQSIYVSVEEVVRLGLDGIEHNRPIVVPGIAMKLAMLLIRLTPMPILRLASRFAR